MKLLICITYHHTSDQHLKNLFFNLQNIKDTYKCSYKVVIHVNSEEAKQLILNDFPDTEVHVAGPMFHPWALTWGHRQYIKDHINVYDVFMYIEDDMLIKYEQLTNYLENLESVWPNYIPTFIRYEVNDEGERYALDIQGIRFDERNILSVNDKRYYRLHGIYCACWILPAKILKEHITDVFTNTPTTYEQIRTTAASYTNGPLRKALNISLLLELEKDQLQLSELCTIHHLSNRYIKFPIKKYFSITKLTDIFTTNI